MQNEGTQNRLVDCVGQTFVIAYKEPTEQITAMLTGAGFDCSVLRQVQQSGYETYSPSFFVFAQPSECLGTGFAIAKTHP